MEIGQSRFGLGQDDRHAPRCIGEDLQAVLEVGEFSERSLFAPQPIADHRLGNGPDIEFGIERAGDAFDQHHGFLQQHQFGPRLHLEQFGDGEELPQHPRHRDIGGRAAMQRLADRADGEGEIIHRLVVRHIADIEMALRHHAVIAGDEAVTGYRRGTAAPPG